jgi:hypothetical protein
MQELLDEEEQGTAPLGDLKVWLAPDTLRTMRAGLPARSRLDETVTFQSPDRGRDPRRGNSGHPSQPKVAVPLAGYGEMTEEKNGMASSEDIDEGIPISPLR